MGRRPKFSLSNWDYVPFKAAALQKIKEGGQMRLDYQGWAAIIQDEAERAAKKHPAMNSHHEAYAVIKEEFEEYWAEVVKGGSVPRDSNALQTELVQTAAMCLRALHDLSSCGS